MFSTNCCYTTRLSNCSSLSVIYTIDVADWYRVLDRLEKDDLDFILHYADGIGYVGLEFKREEDLEFFILKYGV